MTPCGLAYPISATTRPRKLCPPPQMFREYPNDVTLNGGGFVKQVGRNSFNGVSQRQKLRLPRDAFRTLHACQLVHRGVTDLTLDRFAVVQHRKSECQPLGVVSYNLASGQRHRSTPSLRLVESRNCGCQRGAHSNESRQDFDDWSRGALGIGRPSLSHGVSIRFSHRRSLPSF